MFTLDVKKDLKELYNPSTKIVSTVQVPPMNFLMIDGKGDPNTSSEYVLAIEALYGLAYTLKFTLKKAGKADYGVPPLEGLWWVENMAEFDINHKEKWLWTMMIMQPKIVSAEYFRQAVKEVSQKKDLSNLAKVRLECYEEGLAAQLMHIGTYAAEGPNIAKIHEYIREQGGNLGGKHHEIYLSDPRRSAPDKLKTIIRQPFSR